MKKTLAFILFAVMMFGCLGINIFASDEYITPYLNNASNTQASFDINEDGLAIISVRYIGYQGVTAGAKITTVLQKRTLLFFWNDVMTWEDVSNKKDDSFQHTYSVKSGTYRVQIHFEISNVNGEVETVDYEYQKKH